MTETKPTTIADFTLPDPARFAQNLARLAEQAALLAQVMSSHQEAQQKEAETQVVPIAQVSKTLSEVWQAHLNDPNKLVEAQTKLWAQYTEVWNNAWARALGQPVKPVIEPARSDKRFKDRNWVENTVFDFMKQIYLVSVRWAQEMVANAPGLDDHTRQKARFYVENIANALSPSNYALTNPEVLRTTFATSGENLLRGLEKLAKDFQTADGRLRISQVDGSAFKLGENIATTPGKVVFRNDVFELIQYSPQVARTFEIPLLIVPPWINKFYILDLTPQKSFVRWCVENGLTVFVMSWVNADEEQGRKSFSDYMRQGFITAVDAVQKATGSDKVNTVGFCIGGSLVASSLGYMAAKNDKRVNAATFFTTQVDFEKAGDLLVYVDDEQVKWIEERMQAKGYLPGARMADAFNLLRSNDLIWSYVVNNYLLGKDPAPFDLLYWNSDSTRMPAGVHSFYLRECYLENRLSNGRMVLDNVRIDLKKVKIPVYNLAAKDDHIAPLPSVFRLGKYFGGETTLVVSGSGHIAGVVNPPAAQKYQYWVDGKSTASHEEWLRSATEHAGSWWPHWLEWITAKSGDKIAAPIPGEGKLPVLGDAPGEYVRVKGVA
ncbi:MAG: class I poly(R)-hydroxyalkanoic acid synthase [Proteobacteria bacterium]|nr:class I poly(R)-hydroxyalkanoic acid synthase [Pseudomonadota bacterium]